MEMQERIDGIKLYEVGKTLMGGRVLGIDVSKGSNLFKVSEEDLPLFNGYRTVSAATLPFYERKKHFPKQSSFGNTRDYLEKLKEVSEMLRSIDMWDLSIRSNDEAEDEVIIGQLRWLNRLSPEEFIRITRLNNLPLMLPNTGGMSCVDFETFKREVEEDPTLMKLKPRVCPGEDLGFWDLSKSIGEQFPPELSGFGVKVNLWSGDYIYVGYKHGKFLWHSASVSDGSDMQEDFFAPPSADITNLFYARQWSEL